MNQWVESEFNTYDGLSLFYRYRKPKKPSENALIFLHRGHEHSARIMPFADKLSQEDYWCLSFDLRGHGLSQGLRAWAPNFESWVKDLNSFVGHIHKELGISSHNSILVANSIGSVMAVSWILNYGPNLKGCILGAPAFSIKLYIPMALPALKLVSKLSTKKFVTSYVRSNLLTRDEKEADAYDNDPLITKKIGVNVLVTLFETNKNCFKRLKDFETPVLIFTAKNDYIVQNKLHTTFYDGISSSTKKHIVLEGFRHALFHEKEQQKLIEPSRAFIESAFKKHNKQLPAVIPTPRSHTVDEYEQLQEKGSKLKQLYYWGYRYLLTKIGRYSEGISVGLKYGFDSGVSLDYVYQNKASGTYWLGRFIDRIYLNSVGWKGIRTRKQNLKTTLIGITKLLHDRDKNPVILDIASGPARYLFEIQKEMDFSIQLYLNDVDEFSVAHARTIAKEFNSQNTVFNNNDVFSGINTEEFSQKPNIIVISGLFELYENNHHVHKVISNMHKVLADDGYLIYTGQPWHPQLELIGRILNNRNGKRWTMRRRIQNEMDQLVESAGFSKLSTESDDLGIFTVSCAQKA